jgi:2'-5' RNA ligase
MSKRIPLVHPPVSLITIGTRQYRKVAVDASILAAPSDASAMRQVAANNQSADLSYEYDDEALSVDRRNRDFGADGRLTKGKREDKQPASSVQAVASERSQKPKVPKPQVNEAPVSSEAINDISQLPAELQNRVHSAGPNRWLASLEIESVFFKTLIGPQGSTIKKLQQESGCTITIPRGASELVTIESSSLASIVSAYQQVNGIIASAAEAVDYTHFISIPLTNGAQSDAVRRFQAITVGAHARGIDETVLVPPEQFHFTVCMLKLWSPALIAQAAEALRSVKNSAFNVQLRGTSVMNADESQAHVMYAGVSDAASRQLLDQLALDIVNALQRCGAISAAEISKQQLRTSAFKWHATLINSRYRRPIACVNDEPCDQSSDGDEPAQSAAAQKGGKRKKWAPRISFDARAIMNASEAGVSVRDFDFGTVDVRQVHLSARKPAPKRNEFYLAAAVVDL